MVLGHTGCGAVKAAMKADIVPGRISSLYPHLRRAVEQSAGNLDKAIEANARLQAELLGTFSTVIREATKAGTVKVPAGVSSRSVCEHTPKALANYSPAVEAQRQPWEQKPFLHQP
jgi:carbonic anhydrase